MRPVARSPQLGTQSADSLLDLRASKCVTGARQGLNNPMQTSVYARSMPLRESLIEAFI